ncbi:MAG: hypothetical protein GXX94_09760 [Chloroflexi bacterium]|mgnify:CR=1 FL=1|nr:hypothetical protein [Chloroflexota bacterium]
MSEPRSIRPVTVSQVVGVLALAIIVFFIVAFAGKAIRTYRLRAWRDDLLSEIASMEQERQDLVLEIGRRESAAWIDEALKETGRVPPGVLSVRLVSPERGEGVVRNASQEGSSGPDLAERVQGLSFFENDNWRAWVQLLTKRD